MIHVTINHFGMESKGYGRTVERAITSAVKRLGIPVDRCYVYKTTYDTCKSCRLDGGGCYWVTR